MKTPTVCYELYLFQLAWATTKFVGCAVQDCGGKKMVVVCNYSPAGNVKDHVIYEMGKPCLNCPSGTSCFPDEGLCVFPDNSIFSWLRSLQI
ncbi:hypothetical protein OESDEN_01464 [Oesophagostomum dentatum]|uniref:SCP domain-containing protein n=1 Tax=Oesophagostomum dentatum TaxID=61180 RepID=A0A0B1TR19_OESDE|nr:hypothetical protein OESDEN_01464 [Oesophagostomum dentatum]